MKSQLIADVAHSPRKTLSAKVGLLLSTIVLALPASVSAESVKVAFTGDQGVDKHARAVLSLIASEGTDLLMIQGDLGYGNGNAGQWEENLTNALGADFPVLSLVGNHENFEWPIYQRYIQRRIDRAGGLSCSGNTGVKSTCRYKNLEVVQVSPGISEVEGVRPDDDYAGYIRSSFSGNSSRWRICSWHKNQRRLQTGEKGNSTGWSVYDACLDAGAMVALAHEHAYSRTHLLSNFENQTVVHKGSDMTLRPGQSFAFVSGLGGYSVREQKRDGDWWASVYTASQGATHGALFCTFNDFTADCYFKAVDGSVPDRFSLRLASGSGSSAQNPAPPAPSVSNVQADMQVDSKPTNDNGLPERPANLHADIYSKTSFELFWDRVPDAILEYEVSVDGEFADLTDGTSWYVRNLEAGRRYVVDVVAIDIFGNRSPASTVVVSEGGNVKPSAASASADSNSGQSGDVDSPQNAWIDVYSKTAAELFWDRPPAEKRIVNTQVVRDGVLIGETDGTSFFDDERIRGKSYRYELIAITASGNASSPTVVSE